MSGKIIIKRPVISTHAVDVDITVSEDLKEFFNNHHFHCDYTEKIEEVPPSVAILPLLCNIIPVAWLMDADVEVEEIDKDFYDCIDYVKQGYKDMYPMINFGGRLTAKEYQKNEYLKRATRKVGLFFSGGVDSYSSLVAHHDECPILLSIIGSDISLKDTYGRKKLEDMSQYASKIFNTQKTTIISNFREILNESTLSKKVEKSGDGWWHGFQHGIAIIGHAAPLCYLYGIELLYIASSYSAKDGKHYTCASDPTIDSHVRFCGTQVSHDQYEHTRQEKLIALHQYVETFGKRIPLHVCWETSGGNNCGQCEKCQRTILGLYAEKADPTLFGFENSPSMKEICNRLYKYRYISPIYISFYKDIQSRIKLNYSMCELPLSVLWFSLANLNNINNTAYKRFKRILHRHKRLHQIIKHLKKVTS